MTILLGYLAASFAFSVLYCLAGYCASARTQAAPRTLANGRLERRRGASKWRLDTASVRPDVRAVLCA